MAISAEFAASAGFTVSTSFPADAAVVGLGVAAAVLPAVDLATGVVAFVWACAELENSKTAIKLIREAKNFICVLVKFIERYGVPKANRFVLRFALSA
ncbi:hypothetical protein HMJ29_07950 [Hymenobacter taeanensis]|uniref:Uncharacterized protein n=1 Tax=Hymenobacter taeanensis TaxID=2735321 RepID=A0A6M6BG88_9BACT|nr:MULTISPECIES: hypothetical protein [Hymenobacter]QJX46868.1 hypothetical protein HMJ29_07950 [Hymenobacter taeanensis]UOQ80740.1 hypothetical protein MUN83_18295 [Hymenobacter sp. 5414T-23]